MINVLSRREDGRCKMVYCLNRRGIAIRIIAIAVVCLFLSNSVSFSNEIQDTLSPQSMFDPLSESEIGDIGALKALLMNSLLSDENFLKKNSDRAFRLEDHPTCITVKFCLKDKNIFTNGFMLPVVVDRKRQYFAYITAAPGEQVGFDITVFTDAEYKRGVVPGHYRREEPEEERIATVFKTIPPGIPIDDITIADVGVAASDHQRIVNPRIRALVERGDDCISLEGLEDFEIHIVGIESDMFIDEDTGQRAHAGGISTVGS